MNSKEKKYYCETCKKETLHNKEEIKKELSGKKTYKRIYVYCSICNKENYPYEIYSINDDRINRVIKKKGK